MSWPRAHYYPGRAQGNAPALPAYRVLLRHLSVRTQRRKHTALASVSRLPRSLGNGAPQERLPVPVRPPLIQAGLHSAPACLYHGAPTKRHRHRLRLPHASLEDGTSVWSCIAAPAKRQSLRGCRRCSLFDAPPPAQPRPSPLALQAKHYRSLIPHPQPSRPSLAAVALHCSAARSGNERAHRPQRLPATPTMPLAPKPTPPTVSRMPSSSPPCALLLHPSTRSDQPPPPPTPFAAAVVDAPTLSPKVQVPPSQPRPSPKKSTAAPASRRRATSALGTALCPPAATLVVFAHIWHMLAMVGTYPRWCTSCQRSGPSPLAQGSLAQQLNPLGESHFGSPRSSWRLVPLASPARRTHSAHTDDTALINALQRKYAAA
jgi:hypothetical protein